MLCETLMRRSEGRRSRHEELVWKYLPKCADKWYKYCLQQYWVRRLIINDKSAQIL
jgi:hypothetical protein